MEKSKLTVPQLFAKSKADKEALVIKLAKDKAEAKKKHIYSISKIASAISWVLHNPEYYHASNT
jgi:hypothetical protein